MRSDIFAKIERRAPVAVLGVVLLSIAWWTGSTFKAYTNFRYDSLDLGIYAQVFWNTSQGRWFAMSIHPQSYLGDHFELILLPLSFFYNFWTDPRMLLLLQVVALHLAVLPLFLFAKNYFSSLTSETVASFWLQKHSKLTALGIVVLYLLNPFLHNTMAFEFHLLPFVLLPLLTALYYAERGRYWPTLACLTVALFVREDTALLVALFGLTAYLAFPRTRTRQASVWIAPPLIAAVLWLILATSVVAAFSPSGNYKFASYYTAPLDPTRDALSRVEGAPLDPTRDALSRVEGAPSGSGIPEFRAALKAPLTLVQHFFKFRNLETFLALLLPVAFVPLVAPVSLLLLVLPFLEFALPNADSRTILTLHYASVFIPALLLGTVLGLGRIARRVPSARLQHYLERLRWPSSWPFELTVSILLVTAVYASITMGPRARADVLNESPLSTGERASLAQAIKRVSNGSSVVSSNRLLPYLAHRQKLYLARYVFAGQQQLSALPYVVPKPVDILILDQRDLVRPLRIWRNGQSELMTYQERSLHLQKFMAENNLVPTWSSDGVAIFRPASTSAVPAPLVTVTHAEPSDGVLLAPGIRGTAELADATGETIALRVRWFVETTINNLYFLDLRELDRQGKTTATHRFSPDWGIAPTNTWQAGSTIQSTFQLSRTPKAVTLSLELLAVTDTGLPLQDTNEHASTMRRLTVALP